MSDKSAPADSEISAFLFAANAFCTLIVLISATGVVCNSLLLFTTIRSKSLRSPCNILIGSCALFDVLHQFLPEMGVSGGTFSVLSIGIDRFLSIVSPNRYRKMNTKKYLLAQYSAISAYCIYIAFLMVYFFRDQVLICGIAHVFHDEAVAIWSYSGVVVNVTAFAFYILTWRLIKSKSQKLEIDKLRKIFRTIVLVTTIELGGFTICQTIVSTSHWFDQPGHKHICMMMVAANFVNAGIASKFIVYYLSSTEYRKAFNSLFKWEIASKLSRSTTTSKHSMKK